MAELVLVMSQQVLSQLPLERVSNVVLLGLKVHEPFLTDEAVSKLLARRVIIPHWETVDRLRFLFPFVQMILKVLKELLW